jgi:hypothetical protein
VCEASKINLDRANPLNENFQPRGGGGGGGGGGGEMYRSELHDSNFVKNHIRKDSLPSLATLPPRNTTYMRAFYSALYILQE